MLTISCRTVRCISRVDYTPSLPPLAPRLASSPLLESMASVSPMPSSSRMYHPQLSPLKTCLDYVIDRLPTLSASQALSASQVTGSRISTGSEELDRAIGGGLSRGKITELCGPPGSGKTTVGYIFDPPTLHYPPPSGHCSRWPRLNVIAYAMLSGYNPPPTPSSPGTGTESFG